MSQYKPPPIGFYKSPPNIKTSDDVSSTGNYIHVMELPSNPLIPSRYLMQVYDRNAMREHGTKNQRVKYIKNDEYPNWRETASVLEQHASVPSEGHGWLFEFNNFHNGAF